MKKNISKNNQPVPEKRAHVYGNEQTDKTRKINIQSEILKKKK